MLLDWSHSWAVGLQFKAHFDTVVIIAAMLSPLCNHIGSFLLVLSLRPCLGGVLQCCRLTSSSTAVTTYAVSGPNFVPVYPQHHSSEHIRTTQTLSLYHMSL